MRNVGSCLALALTLLGAACGDGGGTTTEATPAPAPGPAPTPMPSSPGEVFALADPGDTGAMIQSYAVKTEIAGVAWRATWKQVEPADGTWDWARLDAALDAVAAAGKKLTIHIGVSGDAWPVWLTTAGAATYSGRTITGINVTDPVPWDSIFLGRYDRMMRQLAAHVTARGQTGLLRLVSVGAPVSEMSLVACSGSVLGSAPTAVAYSRTQYLSAWTSATNTVVSAFPSTTVAVSAPVSQICSPDNDGSAFYSALMTPLTGASVFAADLNALGSQRYAQVTSGLASRALFFQTIWSSTNDPTNRMQGTLSSAVCAGRALGARYFELYKSDLDSSATALVTAVKQANGTAACP